MSRSEEENLNEQQLRNLVRDKIRITDILYKHNPNGNYYPNQTCFCPFHDNSQTPSASIYDNDGVETLYCFSERRLYTSADAIEVLLKKDVYKVAEALWDRLPESSKQSWLQNNGKTSYKDLFNEDLSESKQNQGFNLFNGKIKGQEKETHNDITERLSDAFKRGKISLGVLLDKYIESKGEYK
jgi:hypothetical protein